MSNTAILQEFDAISPLEEMAAYEALWDEDAASFKYSTKKGTCLP